VVIWLASIEHGALATVLGAFDADLDGAAELTLESNRLKWPADPEFTRLVELG
jgi:hypothetical protein